MNNKDLFTYSKVQNLGRCVRSFISWVPISAISRNEMNSFYDPDTNRRSDGRLHAHDKGEKLGDSRLQITANLHALKRST